MSLLLVSLVVSKLMLGNGWPLQEEMNEIGGDSAEVDLSHLGELVFGRPSTKSGEILENWDGASEVNPEEMGEYLEGDILFPADKRNGLIATAGRWEAGEIPYEIVGDFTSSDVELINKAIGEYHRLTCIKFKKRTALDSDYVAITSSKTGCWSSVGKTGGRQELNLQSPGCLSKIGTPIHELMHAVGFTHEQNRWERDDYVEIVWDNIQNGKDNNFKKAPKDKVTGFGIAYDYNSVMHYSEKSFSVNGKSTIVAKSTGVKMGQREGFSRGDVSKIRKMYNCTNDDKNEIKEEGSIFTPGGILSLIFG